MILFIYLFISVLRYKPFPLCVWKMPLRNNSEASFVPWYGYFYHWSLCEREQFSIFLPPSLCLSHSPYSPIPNILMYTLFFVSFYSSFQLCYLYKKKNNKKRQSVNFRCPTALWKTVIAGSFFSLQPPSHLLHIKPYIVCFLLLLLKNDNKKTKSSFKTGLIGSLLTLIRTWGRCWAPFVFPGS